MMKVLFVCLAATAVLAQDNSTEQGNTRIFGLGNLISGLAGRPNRPNRPFRPGFNQGGFNQGFNQGGFNQGFNQGGFNQGFNQGFRPGFNQGGFNQGFNQGFRPGFNQGGFNQGFNQGSFTSNQGFNFGSVIGGLASGLLSGGRPPFQGGFNQFKPGQCPPVRPSCPDTRLFGAPQPCNNDFRCSGSDKCCFDSCLRERVCKPVSQFGR